MTVRPSCSSGTAVFAAAVLTADGEGRSVGDGEASGEGTPLGLGCMDTAAVCTGFKEGTTISTTDVGSAPFAQPLRQTDKTMVNMKTPDINPCKILIKYLFIEAL